MAATARGHIEELPSGSFRVHVYAGTDPVTGKRRRIKETCPDYAAAAAALGRLLAEVNQERFPDRDATLGHTLDKYIEVADLEVSTREAHDPAALLGSCEAFGDQDVCRLLRQGSGYPVLLRKLGMTR